MAVDEQKESLVGVELEASPGFVEHNRGMRTSSPDGEKDFARGRYPAATQVNDYAINKQL